MNATEHEVNGTERKSNGVATDLWDFEEFEQVMHLDGRDARGRSQHTGNDLHGVFRLRAVRALVGGATNAGDGTCNHT